MNFAEYLCLYEVSVLVVLNKSVKIYPDIQVSRMDGRKSS